MAKRRLRVPLDATPDQAIAIARAANVMLPEQFYALPAAKRAMAFTVSALARLDQVQAVADALVKFMADGGTFEDFRRWALQQDWSLPRHRLETIYRNAVQTAYQAGHWRAFDEAADELPYLMYDAINDSRVRPTHLALDGVIRPVRDPYWRTHAPPLGHRCRCTLRQISRDEAARRGGVTSNPPAEGTADSGWGFDPREALRRMRSLYGERRARAPRAIAAAAERVMERAPDPRPLGERLRRIGEQRGSMPGGLYEDSATGERWYVKLYPQADQARSEMAALGIYRALGITVPDAEMVTMDGRLGIASRWIDGLRRAASIDEIARNKDIGRLWQAAVLTEDWDVVGLSLDNVLLSTDGRLVKLDAGGSFRFRARGGAKEYGASIDLVRSLRDAAINPSAARVFNAAFDADVFAEADGIAAVAALGRAEVERIFAGAGFVDGDVQALSDTLMRRAAALVERYGEAALDAVPGARALRDRMRAKWGTARIALGEEHAAVRGMMLNFERLLFDEIGSWAAGVAKDLIGNRHSGWAQSSSSPAGAVMKVWARERMGAKINYHDGTRRVRARIDRDVEEVKFATGRRLDELLKLFDYEYAWHQYYLRRMHGWDLLTLRRGMETPEFNANFDQELGFLPNALSSFSIGHGFSAPRRVEVAVPVDLILKAYWQGERYLLPHEREYIVIGSRRLKARRL